MENSKLPHSAIIFYLSVFQISGTCDFNSRLQHRNVFAGQDVILPCLCESAATVSSYSKYKLDQELTVWTIANDSSPQRIVAYASHKEQGLRDLKEIDKIASQSGNAEGASCTFPFTVKDKFNKTNYHFTCLDSGREDASCWCSTSSDFTVDEKWGFCPCAFPTPGVRLLAEYGTSPGDYCHFPFKYKGNVYKECTTDHRPSGRCWCGTTYDVDVDEKWGFCPCASTAFRGNWGTWGIWTKCTCGELRFRSRPCYPHFELKNIPTGRQVLCDGDAMDIEICSCDQATLIGGISELIDLRGRVIARPRSVVEIIASNISYIVIKNAKVADSGLYFCNKLHVPRAIQYDKLSLVRMGAYHINVVEVKSLEMVLEDKGGVPSQQQGLYGLDWLVWHWTEWQACDRCGIFFGERRKYGFCYTSANLPRGLQGNRLPCKSPLLPIDKRERLNAFPNYMTVQRCKARCPRNTKKYVLVKATSGSEPKMPKPANREVARGLSSDDIILRCSGASPTLPVAWQFDEPDEVGQTWALSRHKRIKGCLINVEDNLHIQKIMDHHAGYYSCFVNGSLAISHRLFVVDDDWKQLYDAVDYSIFLVISVVAIVFIVALCGTLKAGKFKF